MARPFVSVLIDTYNHERFIEKAIVSVLDQDFPSEEMEILVVDDGSTDQTPEIVRKFEPRLRLIRKTNGGQASAFNVGISEAQGEIVAFLDGDDWWTSSKLREVSEAFKKNPDVGAVGHGYYEVDLDAPTNELIVPVRSFRLTLSDVAGAHSFFALCGFLGTSRLAVRKDVLGRILPVPEELVFIADAFIYTLAVALTGAIVLDLPLCYYRVHARNLFATQDPIKNMHKLEMQAHYVKRVSPKLSALGVPHAVMVEVVEPLLLDLERVHLARHGGKTWRTFQIERAADRWAYAEASLGYKLFKAFVLGLTLLIPPRRFYQLKQWYSEKGLRRYREKVGTHVSTESVHLRRERVPIEMRDAL